MNSTFFRIGLAALLTLAAASTTEEAPRRPRQLDLGPDTNQVNQPLPSNPQQSNFQQPGYLPPVEPAGAQDDPVVLRPTQSPQNPTHHGRDLCTDPFHSFLCSSLKPRRPITGDLPGQKNFESSGNTLFGANTFLEPSKVLAPPLNDLEETLTTTARRPPPPSTTTTRRPPPPPTTTTTRRPPPPPPTTTRTTTTTTTTTRKPTTTSTTERLVAPEPSNDVRSYLPPERIDPAAAQPDIAVVRPDDTEDHHHPHHHGRDLCTDPFHSFLCTPLKPRKRITGDLPNSIQGQNTFLNPKKVLPDVEVSPQPSNEIDRAYLPPSTTRRPPPTTTTTIRVIPQASNEIDRAYLPPSTTTRPITTTSTTTRRPTPPPFVPQPSNEIDRAYLPPSTTSRPFTFITTTRRPNPPPFVPQPSNEIQRAYIPPVTTTKRPLTTPRLPTIRFRPEPSNDINRAYLPPVTTTTTRRPPPPPPTTRTPIPPPPIVPQPSNEIERSYLPPVSPQPSNVEKSYLPPEPKIEPAAAQNDPAIAAPDSDHDHDHHHGSHGFKDICSDPFHSFLCVSPKPRVRITGDLPARFRNNGINPAPSNIDESRVKVLEHKSDNLKIIVLPKDVETPQPSQQLDTKVPLPSNINQGYSYPKPENRFPLPSDSKPIGIPTTKKPITTTGYSYPKPDNKLTLPSETKEVVGYDYPKPLKPFPEDKGYSYPKPEVKLTLPSEVKEVVGYDYPKPTTPRPTTIKLTTTVAPRPTTTGYSYPKPENKLPLPSERKEVTGYEYPKPSISFPSPTKGYSYPKPESKLTLPTEKKEVLGYDYPKPSIGLPLPTKGYDYPKPERRLTLPSFQNPEIKTPTLTNAQRIVNSYTSPSPSLTASSTKSVLPNSIQEARERLQTKKVQNIGTQNALSDFIPVNKVEFPSDGELGVRFGERLKRRERSRHLIPPAGSHRL